jgi:hypothetical protein
MICSNTVANIICGIFKNLVGKYQGEIGSDGKPTEKKALLVRFEAPGLMDMLIHAPYNSVGVYTRKVKLSPGSEIFSKWELISFHDSCWRSDGVEQILFVNRENFYLESICSLSRKHKEVADGIYIINLSNEEINKLRDIERKR